MTRYRVIFWLAAAALFGWAGMDIERSLHRPLNLAMQDRLSDLLAPKLKGP